MKRILISCLMSSLLCADPINVFNHTSQDLWGAIYYKNSSAQRASSVKKIPANGMIKIDRPGRQFGKDRSLAVSLDKNDLQPQVSMPIFTSFSRVNVGDTRGSNFYIARKDGKITGFNEISWKVVAPTIKKVSGAAKGVVSKLLNTVRPKDFPHKNQVASVRTGVDISPEEKVFRSKRMPAIRKGISQITAQQTNQKNLPTIAFCFSGGGYRALLASSGYLAGAEQMGLLDAAMYICTLSGSTWSSSSWVTCGTTATAWKDQMVKAVQQPFFSISKQEWADISRQMLVKLSFNEDVGPMDMWGGHLGAKLLTGLGNPEKYRFSEAAAKVARGEIPWLICTAAADNITSVAADYKFFEFSPHEIGSTYLNAWVPTWSFGRRFQNGKSINAVPEQSLPYLMGVFGSAFALALPDIIIHIPLGDDPVRKAILQPIIEKLKNSVARGRPLPGSIVPNFAFELPQAPSYARKQNKLEFVDAGFSDISSPVPPLLRPQRNIDIMVMFDMNETHKGGKFIRTAVEYARKNRLRFPPFDVAKAERQSISVFGDPSNPKDLVIIFLSRIKNPQLPPPYNFDVEEAVTGKGKWAHTTAFRYSGENARLLSGWAYHNLFSHKTIIQDVIQKRLAALNRSLSN